MKISFKKLISVLLSIIMIFILTACGNNKASEDNLTSKESTTTTTTITTTTKEITTNTTEAESTKATDNTTEINNLTEAKPTEAKTTAAKTTQAKPDVTKPKPTEEKTTQVKATESKPKPTQAKPQKETPKFIFTQKFPVKVTAFSAEFEVVKAYTDNGYWYNDDTYLFDLSIVVKRCDDGINEEKASAVAMTIKDSNGNVVRRTSSSAGMLKIGEQGTGSMAWSVDGPGTYTIEFSSI